MVVSLSRDARQRQNDLRRLLENKHYLHYRRVRQRANRLKRLHDLIERHVLVRERVQHDLFRGTQMGAERGKLIDLVPQRQCVHEEAHKRLEIAARAPGSCGANHNVFPGTKPR